MLSYYLIYIPLMCSLQKIFLVNCDYSDYDFSCLHMHLFQFVFYFQFLLLLSFLVFWSGFFFI